MSKLSNKMKVKRNIERDLLKTMGFKLGKTIGEGTYSKVCSATKNNGETTEKVACKIIHRKYAGIEFIQKFLPRELRIMRCLKHDNIIRVHQIIDTKESICIIMDFCQNGDLLEYIKNRGPLDELLAKAFFRQIIEAVHYLHSVDIAHRDLKCENILITHKSVIKIGDFGFARCCVGDNGNDILSQTFCGSAAYAAPEIIQGIPYDPKMYDIWALGCILYIMITATMPFDDSNIRRMLRNQLNRSLCILTFKTWKKHCVHLKNLLSYLLEPDVARRATINEVINCVWLKGARVRKIQPNIESNVSLY